MPLHWTDAAAIRIGGEEAADDIVQIGQDGSRSGAQYGVPKPGRFV
jgi:hypothetical protein